MGLSKQIRAGLSVMLMTATILGSQVAATKDMEAYAHHTGSSTTLKSSKVRKPSTTPAPNRFHVKTYRGQKVYTSAREIVNQAFKDAGINGKRKKYFSAARNVQAQEIAHLEKVVRHFESRLRRMNLSPNAQGRKEIERETMKYFDTKILPRFKRLRKAEINSSVHKSWSYMNDTGNYSSMYDYYISPGRVSEMYFKYLRERLRITTALRTRTGRGNTLPDQVFKAYYGSIKRVHLLYQQYKAGEYVLAIAKYEHYKDAYGADTLMALARGRTKKGYVPVVNLRDFRDQVPDVQATMKLNLIFGGRETKHTRKIENKLKAELQQEYNKSIVEVIAMAAEDAVARLAKEGYHYYNNRYVVLSGLFDFLIFDVDILNAPTKARLATKADELRSITGIKKGASVADDVPTPRSRTSNATDDLDNARSTKRRRTQDDAPDNRRRSQQDEIEAKKKKQQQEEANNRRRNSSCGKSVAYVPTGRSFGFGLAMINPSPLLAFFNPSSNLIAVSKSNCYTTGTGDLVDDVQYQKMLQDGGELEVFKGSTFRNDDVISGNLNKTLSETNKTLKNVGIDVDLRELSFKRRGGKKVKLIDSNGSTTKYISPVDKPGGLPKEKVLNIRSKKAKYVAELDDSVFTEAFDEKKAYVQYLDASDLPVNRRTSKVRIADEFSTNSQQVYLYDNPSPEFYNVNYKIYETKVDDNGVLKKVNSNNPVVEIGSHPDGHFNNEGAAGAIGDPMPKDANSLVPHLNVKISDPARAKAAARNVIMNDFDGKVPKGTQSSLDKVREVKSHFVYDNSYPRQRNGGKIPSEYVTENAKTIKQYYNAAVEAKGNFSQGSTFLTKVKKIRSLIPGRIRRAIKNFSISK